MGRRAILGLLLAVTVAWTFWAFTGELRRVFDDPPAQAMADRPARWNLRTPQVAELAAFLTEADRHLPPTSLITVASRPLPGSQEFFLYLWHAYYLPQHDVVRAVHGWSLEHADYLITYGATAGELDLDLQTGPPLLEGAESALYRLQKP